MHVLHQIVTFMVYIMCEWCCNDSSLTHFFLQQTTIAKKYFTYPSKENILSKALRMEKMEKIMTRQKKVLRKIFLSTLYLSTFTFGGGYVIVTLMKEKFVDQYHWIKEEEMLDLVAIAQSAPGAIAVNGAIVVGYELAGLRGAAVAIFGTILPPFAIIALLSVCYHAFRTNYLIGQMLEGMQAGVAAVIATVTYEMGLGIVTERDKLSIVIMLGAFVASCVFQVNVIYVVIVCGLIGALRTYIEKRRKAGVK